MSKKLTKTNPDYDKIIERCKELYITPNARGNYLSHEKIVRKLSELFDITMTTSMIRYWNDKFDWDDIRQKSKMVGMAKSRSEQMTQEESLTNELQEKIAGIYKQQDGLSIIATRIIVQAYESGNLSPTNAIKLLKDATDTKLKLLGIDDRLNVSITDTRMEELKRMSPEELAALKTRLLERLQESIKDEGKE